MNISRLKNVIFGAVLVTLTYAPVFAETPAKDERLPLAEMWVRTSAEYRGLCYQAYNVTSQQFENWQPLLIKGKDGKAHLPGSDKPVAIIMDLDETVISNAGYQVFLYRAGQSFNPATWDAWLEYQSHNKAAGPALPGVVEFLKEVEGMGVTPVFISNRSAGHEEETTEVLKNAGINVDDIDHRLWLRKDGDALTQQDQEFMRMLGVKPGTPAANEVANGEGHKEGRQLYIESKYDVISYFGDVYGDFEPFVAAADSGMSKLQQRNARADANRNKFGRAWFILPNPMYGYWGVGSTIPADKMMDAMNDYGFEVYMRGRRMIKH